MNLTQRYNTTTCLSGSILLSHPNLLDPNFDKSILFISAHSEDQGSLGVILNRPTGKTLCEIDLSFKNKYFEDLPVFEGGPVEKDKLIVAAWEWMETPSAFKLYFGIDLEKAKALSEKSNSIQVACFRTCRMVSEQLDDELSEDAWLVSNLDYNFFQNGTEEKIGGSSWIY